MATYWFTAAPVLSHLDWGGFLKTARYLHAQGDTVIGISGEAMRSPLAGARIPFEAIPETGWLATLPPLPDPATISPQEAVMVRYLRALDTWLSVDLVRDATQHLIELAGRIGKPDAIVSDPLLTAAGLAAEALDVPLIVVGMPALDEAEPDNLYAVQQRLSAETRARLQSLLEHFGLTGSNFSQGATPSMVSPHLHINYFSEAWFSADLPLHTDQNAYVGGIAVPPRSPAPAWLQAIPADQPLALITLGAEYSGELGFFGWAAHAVRAAGLLPVVVIGNHPISAESKQTLIQALPRGARLLNFVSFNHVLPRCKLVIQHGGMGTTHAVLVHGIPQIAVPHAADQREQGRRVAEAKVGLNLTAHDVRNGKLLEGTHAILNNERVIHAAKQFADEMAAAGGIPRAVELVREVVGG